MTTNPIRQALENTQQQLKEQRREADQLRQQNERLQLEVAALKAQATPQVEVTRFYREGPPMVRTVPMTRVENVPMARVEKTDETPARAESEWQPGPVIMAIIGLFVAWWLLRLN